MRISSYSISIPRQITALFEDKILDMLSAQQKKILGVVILILSGFALLYVVKRCCFKAKPVPPFVRPPITPSPPSPKPPFIHDQPPPPPSPKPQSYDWIKKEADVQAFLNETKDIPTIIKVAKSFPRLYHKYPGLHAHIGNLIQYATPNQIESITIALAQKQDVGLLRDIFYYLFKQMEKDPQNLDVYKQKMRAVVRSLSSDQFMTLLNIDASSEYQRQQAEIWDIPLEGFLKWNVEFSFPVQFIDGCRELLLYARDIKPEVDQEIKEHGALCD